MLIRDQYPMENDGDQYPIGEISCSRVTLDDDSEGVQLRIIPEGGLGYGETFIRLSFHDANILAREILTTPFMAVSVPDAWPDLPEVHTVPMPVEPNSYDMLGSEPGGRLPADPRTFSLMDLNALPRAEQ